jgi:hypothetical protein
MVETATHAGSSLTVHTKFDTNVYIEGNKNVGIFAIPGLYNLRPGNVLADVEIEGIKYWDKTANAEKTFKGTLKVPKYSQEGTVLFIE